jgi:energy-coupling factor transporter transmembrane protein EcfT
MNLERVDLPEAGKPERINTIGGSFFFIIIGIILLLHYLFVISKLGKDALVNFILIMKRPIGILAFTLLTSCSYNKTNSLEKKEQVITLSYIAWACDCANWATRDDIQKYNDSSDALADHCIFIEPADKSLTLPDSLGYNGDVIKFTGHFYKEKGFPKSYSSIENPKKASVFQYTQYQVIKSNYEYSTLIH